jgi:hypothetical protein
MTTQIKAGVIAANAVNSSELASGALSGQNFTGDVAFDTTTLKIDSSNNRVGIGTDSPSDKLEIGTTTTGGSLRLVSSSYANNGLLKFFGTDNVERLQMGALSGTAAYIYTPASTDLVTYTGGSEKMRIDASGNLIMTAGGTIRAGGVNDLILDAGESGTPDIYLQSGGATKVKIEGSNGNVGIGEPNPDTILHIKKNQSSANSSIKLENAAGGNNSSFSIDWQLASSGTSAQIKADRTNSPGAGDTDLIFSTSTTGTTLSEAMRIDSSGNVGIGTGTTTPGARLHIKAVNNRTSLTGTGLGTLHIDDGDTPSNNEVASITMGGYTTNALGIIGLQTTNNGTNLFFGTSNNYSAGVSNTAMTINYDGNVLVGTTATSSKFEINHGKQTGALGLGTATSLKLSQATGAPAVGNVVQMTMGYGDTYANIAIAAIRTSATAYGTDDLVFAVKDGTTDKAPPERMRIDSSGLVKINVNNNSHNFKAYASSSNSYFGVYDDANDSANIEIRRSDTAQVFYVLGHTGNYHFAGSDVSDRDLKENIVDVPNGSLELVKQLRPRTYNFKSSEGFENSSRTGFIAQEVADVMTTDHRVASGIDGNKDMGIDPVGLIAHLTKAIQEQQTIIDDLKSRITKLEG